MNLDPQVFRVAAETVLTLNGRTAYTRVLEPNAEFRFAYDGADGTIADPYLPEIQCLYLLFCAEFAERP